MQSLSLTTLCKVFSAFFLELLLSLYRVGTLFPLCTPSGILTKYAPPQIYNGGQITDSAKFATFWSNLAKQFSGNSRVRSFKHIRTVVRPDSYLIE